jgi:ABC-2 type transport system ATP-binding protein
MSQVPMSQVPMSQTPIDYGSMSHDIVIEAKALTKAYGSAVAVDHISFSVGRGEIFGLLGPNGAGKTTTILMLLGLTDISEGEVSVLGFNPAREPISQPPIICATPRG